jgi:enamine deaminase RidA (YjgF/YER057c/UK114 family)
MGVRRRRPRAARRGGVEDVNHRRPAVGYSNGARAPAHAVRGGQVAWDADGRIVSQQFADQFDRALANVLTVVTAAGGTPQPIMRLAIFVTDTAEYLAARREVGERYRARMGRHYPAMTLVEVKALSEGARRIEALAWVSPSGP